MHFAIIRATKPGASLRELIQNGNAQKLALPFRSMAGSDGSQHVV